MDLFSFPLLPRGYIHGFFFFFRIPVLYHSLSSFLSFIPFVQCTFRLLSFFLFLLFFFSFSIFHLSVKSTGGARAEKKRCCVFWAVLAGCYNGRFEFGFSFSWGVFVESWLKKMKKKENIKGSRVMNMWLFCQSVCREGRVFFIFFLCSWPTSNKTSRSSVDDMPCMILTLFLVCSWRIFCACENKGVSCCTWLVYCKLFSA